MKLRLSLLLIVAGITCFIAFKLTGSTIDAEGFLHEPFALIPIGYALCGLGAIGTLMFGGHALLTRKDS